MSELDRDPPAVIDRGRVRTGSPLDKLIDLVPREISIGRPGLRRQQPISCCANCTRISKKQGGRYECHVPGSWFIKEIKGGEISVNMPHARSCFEATKDAWSASLNDPMGSTVEAIDDHVRWLERFFRDNKLEGHLSDSGPASRVI